MNAHDLQQLLEQELAAEPSPSPDVAAIRRRGETRRRVRRLVSGGLILAAVACVAGAVAFAYRGSSDRNPRVTAPPSRGRQNATPTSTPTSASSASPATADIPTVPFGATVTDIIGAACPTETAAPYSQLLLATAEQTGVAFVRQARGWKDATVHAAYPVGTTQGAWFGPEFAHNVPLFCGQGLASATYVVELQRVGAIEQGTSSDRAALAIAKFAGGWRVWGEFHF